MPPIASVILIDLSFLGVLYLFFDKYMNRPWDIPFFVSALCLINIAAMLISKVGKNNKLFYAFLAGSALTLVVSLVLWYFLMKALPELKQGMVA